MKNLIVETQASNVFDETQQPLPSTDYHCCFNSDNNRFYIIENGKNTLVVLDAFTGERYSDGDQIFLPKYRHLKYVGIEYCSITEEFFIACENGIVLCLTFLSSKSFKVQEIAEFPNGLSAIHISPDQEIVILVTKDGQVIVLNSHFDIVRESSISSADFGEKQFITVGWGKKETQFHGSAGKSAAKAAPTVVGKSDTDDGTVKITWRGDGSMFAISYIDNAANARRFKVFDRGGILQYTSELVDCLEGNLSWKPSGNLIASTRKLPNKYTVAFFEKNGLLHREFSLQVSLKDVKIKELIWSRDSDVLAIWLEEVNSGKFTIQLWSEKNYHWYLKQTIVYPTENPILHVSWCPHARKDLMILSLKNSTVYAFYWAVSHSRGICSSDKAVVGVIDGDKVLVTCFRDGIVPPPMAQQTIQFKESVNAISFAPGQNEDLSVSSNDFVVLLSNYKIMLYKNVNESWESQYSCQKTYNVNLVLKNPTTFSNHMIHHLCWYKPDTIYFSLSQGAQSYLCEIELLDIDGLDVILTDTKILCKIPGQIEHIIVSPDSSKVYIVVNSKLYTYNSRDGLMKSNLKITDDSLDRAVVQIEFMKFNEKEVVVALSRKHVLYVDGEQVANNITSFFAHSDFLLLTTLQHSLISFRLDANGFAQLRTRDLTIEPWMNGSKEVHKTQELNIRRVERGSTLIICIPKDEKTILQMPRGNLECIQPRALSLFIIGTLIDQMNYNRAFDLMRKQRIDLNLIYDHNPESFVTNAEKFVNDVKNPSWLSLFLTELKDEDVTRTLYASSYPERKASDVGSNKVERTCELLRGIMENTPKDFVQPILISLVKNQERSGLENALLRIKSMKEKDQDLNDSPSVQEALKYLLFMVDVNVLYDIALGMYDFELVMFVAQKSQKDPKEYLPYLNGLKQLDENYMKYIVDAKLKRYDSALEHIVKLPDRFEECLTFVQAHNLYSKALRLYNHKSTEYVTIAASYGQYLLDKSMHKEAGLLFVKGKKLKEALEAFKLANSWKDAIVTAVQLGYSPAQMFELYDELVLQLIPERRYEEAAKILSKYLNRVEDTVAILCEGRLWHDAWVESTCSNRQDLIESHVRPGVQAHAEFLVSQLHQHRTDFEKYRMRLSVVRAEAAARKARELAGEAQINSDDENHHQDLGDLISDTTSIAGSTVSKSSRSSGRTYRSSKNRRKHERKMHSIKEGSVYEDLALIRALHQLATQAYSYRDEARSMSEMLLLINQDQLAAELNEVLDDFLTYIRKSKRDIWPVVPVAEIPEQSQTDGKGSPLQDSPASVTDPFISGPPEEKPNSWKLDMFSHG
ncbi:hypothetical protein QAD02_014706 [Eretmocerus hayati]|uniref:Uncharacterized protein n=1 Tax=Eretmocerus hayati TaxID=131215 RepID=A0ACC2P8I4_9HYME|nr:hypothetical protein QAD02_014706 [Eretmocerus hayati]